MWKKLKHRLFRRKKVAVFGLGKLGATLAAVLADAGHQVSGYDPAEIAVEAVRRAQPITFEPGLAELLAKSSKLISATTDPDVALREAEAAYIIVPTPSGSDGAFDNSYVRQALTRIAEHLKKTPRRFNIVVASTVMPGSCTEEFIPLLEELSGLSVGPDIGLAYSPEFIALGSIIRDMRSPDLVLIGESDPEVGAFVEEVARSVVNNTPEYRHLSLSSAELAKIAINTFVTTKISFANMLSEMCDALPGADVNDVTSAVGADSRIGRKYLRAGLGYGGPCFPRDNQALGQVAKLRGLSADIALATDVVNNRQISRVVEKVEAQSSKNASILIVGLAYKSGTPVTEESQALAIARILGSTGRKVFVHDPLVGEVGAQYLEGTTVLLAAHELRDRHFAVTLVTQKGLWANIKEVARSETVIDVAVG